MTVEMFRSACTEAENGFGGGGGGACEVLCSVCAV